jgi:type IV secretory pathway VirB10-like protein
VLVGTVIVMAAIMTISGPSTRPRTTAAASSFAATAVDPNRQRIQDYERRIEEQTERLAAEQARVERAKQAAATDGQPAATPGEPSGAAPAQRLSSARTPADGAQREEHARFADNVAYSKPREGSTLSQGGPPAAPASSAPATTPPGPVNREPLYRLLEGTLIETVLTNRLDGTFTGPVNCLVSVPVYASDQQHLVIPAGSRVLGEARAVNTFGQSRLAVAFHRVILPNGAHVDLNGFHGLNQAGDLGLRDQVDRHYAQIFGVSLAIGAIAGFAQAQSAVGLEATSFDVYRQGAAANLSQSSARILDRFLNLLPAVTIREGHRIKVYLSNDLELPAYRAELPTPGGRR